MVMVMVLCCVLIVDVNGMMFVCVDVDELKSLLLSGMKLEGGMCVWLKFGMVWNCVIVIEWVGVEMMMMMREMMREMMVVVVVCVEIV